MKAPREVSGDIRVTRDRLVVLVTDDDWNGTNEKIVREGKFEGTRPSLAV